MFFMCAIGNDIKPHDITRDSGFDGSYTVSQESTLGPGFLQTWQLKSETAARTSLLG